MIGLDGTSIHYERYRQVNARRNLASPTLTVGTYFRGRRYAINGKFSSADVYASNDLFRRMWPKLLKASAVEALAERPKMKASSPPSVSSVRTALSDADLGRVSTTEVIAGTSVVKKDSDKLLVFETRERDERATWLHKSYIVK